MKRYWLAVVGALVASIVIFSGTASGQEPEEPTTTTTEVPAPEIPTTTVPIDLPGEHIVDGSLALGARFANKTESNCETQGSLSGQQMNLVRTETGNIGGVYGKADIGGSSTGLVMIQLGPLPTAIVAYRATGGCEQDVVGLGGFSSTPTSAKFEGIGYGAFPGDFASFVSADVTVTQAGAPATLDLEAASAFLSTPR